jgi:hypothetical protein
MPTPNSSSKAFTLPSKSGINDQLKPSWQWKWSGRKAIVPNAESQEATGEAVHCLRVRPTEDLKLS